MAEAEADFPATEVAGKPFIDKSFIQKLFALTGSQLIDAIVINGLSMPKDDPPIAPPYEIVSVQKTHPPPGGEGSRWYRYIIVQGNNTIHGCRKGSLRAVTSAVETIVAQLNERQTGKRGRVQLVTEGKTKINK